MYKCTAIKVTCIVQTHTIEREKKNETDKIERKKTNKTECVSMGISARVPVCVCEREFVLRESSSVSVDKCNLIKTHDIRCIYVACVRVCCTRM